MLVRILDERGKNGARCRNVIKPIWFGAAWWRVDRLESNRRTKNESNNSGGKMKRNGRKKPAAWGKGTRGTGKLKLA